MYEICSKLSIKTHERRQRHRSAVFFVNYKHIRHLLKVFILLTLNWASCKLDLPRLIIHI